jgi:sugar-specific transcriptional regulator TrmB
MYIKELISLGLDKNQAEVYSVLLKHGTQSGSEIAKKSSVSRPLVYKALEELEKTSMIEKEKKAGQSSKFKPAHPTTFLRFLEREQEKAESKTKAAQSLVEKMSSDFNLISEKPEVEFFEGLRGVQTVLEQTLESEDKVIYTYVDSATIDKEISDIDELYVQKRIKKGIKKKILMLKTKEAELYLKNKEKDVFTEIRLIDNPYNKNFFAVTQIYNKRVSYISFKNGVLTSTIITDESIYNMSRIIFEDL